MTGTKGDIAPWLNNPASGASVYRRSFNQLCAALVWQLCNHFGTAGASYASADAAFRATTISGTNMDSAPAGAVGYYAGGSYGDVAVSMGDGTWLHASSHLAASEMLAPGSYVGFLTDAQYRSRSGYKSRGWSYHYGSAGVTGIVGAAPVQPSDDVRRVASYLNGQGIGHTTADVDGIPGKNYWTMIQRWGSSHGMYPQPSYKINGVPGPQTYKVQAYLVGLTAPATPTPPPVSSEPPVVVPPVVTDPPVVVPPVVTPPVELPPVTTPTEPQEPPVTTTPPADTTTPTTPAEPAQRPLTAVELAAYRAGLEAGTAQLQTVADANIPTALSGLLAAHPTGRKRAYYGYAALALVLSFSGDVITAGILTSQQVPVFVAGVTLATSILLKIGVALGFVAASNTASK